MVQEKTCRQAWKKTFDPKRAIKGLKNKTALPAKKKGNAEGLRPALSCKGEKTEQKGGPLW